MILHDVRERTHVDLDRPRFVGLVSEKAAVRRHFAILFAKRRDEQLARLTAGARQQVEVILRVYTYRVHDKAAAGGEGVCGVSDSAVSEAVGRSAGVGGP